MSQSGRASPSRRAHEATASEETSVAPYGTRTVGENNGTLTVSIPCEVAAAEEIEQGDEVAVGLDTETGELRYVPVEEFEGWK